MLSFLYFCEICSEDGIGREEPTFKEPENITLIDGGGFSASDSDPDIDMIIPGNLKLDKPVFLSQAI